MQENVSEIARIREQIVAEHTAAKLGLQGLNAGTGRHEFITARQERIGALHDELEQIVGPSAIALVVELLTDEPTRPDVLVALRQEFGNEETEALCNDLQEIWRVVDRLKESFGTEQVQKLILAPPSSLQEIPLS